MNDNEIAKKETALALPTEEEVALAFGGEAATPPIDIAFPEIKMDKNDTFIMPDGSTVKTIDCYIVFAQRSRSYWEKDYDGENTPPDCASDDTLTPSQGEEQECETCAACNMAKWAVVEEKQKDGSTKKRNVMPCSQSLNVILLIKGREMPHVMRIRSTSIGPKSKLAAFFANCLENGFALLKKFQLVNVRLTLDEVKIRNFKTSTLAVTKLSTLEIDDQVVRTVMTINAEARKNFVVKHSREDIPASDEDAADPADDEETVKKGVDKTDDIPF